jgi:hypothetical protein
VLRAFKTRGDVVDDAQCSEFAAQENAMFNFLRLQSTEAAAFTRYR